VLWLAVVLAGLVISFYVLPFGLWWSAGAVVLAIIGILLIVPKCFAIRAGKERPKHPCLSTIYNSRPGDHDQ
jgi:hypothetical protein